MTRRISLIVAVVFALGTLAHRAYAGSCGSDSDCAGVGKCSGGQCGACGSDSDCNGHGKCSSGRCGACGSDSDCKVGTCSGGKCGACGSDSDCRGNGKCSSGKCGSCGSDSDCKVGKCSSSHCGSCGSDSDCKGGRCSSGRCSNALAAGLEMFPIGDVCGDGQAPILRLAVPGDLSCRLAPADAIALRWLTEAPAVLLATLDAVLR
jgi:hypothetical protein